MSPLACGLRCLRLRHKDAVADCGEEFVQRIADERPPVRPVGAGLEAHFIHDRRPYAVEDVAQHQVVVVDAEHGVFDEKGCVHVFKVGFAAVVHSFREERNEGQAFQIAEFRFLGKVIGVVPVDDEQGTRLKKFFQFAVIGKNRNSVRPKSPWSFPRRQPLRRSGRA